MPTDPAKRPIGDMTTTELLALMRHQAHRIEKAHYNDLLVTKSGDYQEKWTQLGRILAELTLRDNGQEDPTVAWARAIHGAFPDVYAGFVAPHSTDSSHCAIDTEDVMNLMKSRRSTRVWADEQPTT
jgi:hypothetical protein